MGHIVTSGVNVSVQTSAENEEPGEEQRIPVDSSDSVENKAQGIEQHRSLKLVIEIV